MGKKRIEPGWRMTLAQLALGVVFGRKQHYISPWRHAGVGVMLIVVHGGKVLLHRRGASVEGAGKWGAFGGYVDLEDKERPAVTVSRELWEECGVRAPSKQFERAPDHLAVIYQQEKLELSGSATASLGWFAAVEKDFIGQLMETEEATDYQWFSAAELKRAWDAGEVHSHAEDYYLACLNALKMKTLPRLVYTRK